MELFIRMFNAAVEETKGCIETPIKEHYLIELEHFLHDWVRTVLEEDRCIAANEDGPSAFFEKSMKDLNNLLKNKDV